MIYCLDLRCGNWINTEGFLRPVQVTAHSFPRIKERPHLSSYIPITPSILEKAKFEEKQSKLSDRKYWQKDFIIWHDTGEVFLWNESNKQINVKIEFVHTLQNFFYVLSGKELELSLNPDLSTEELYGINEGNPNKPNK